MVAQKQLISNLEDSISCGVVQPGVVVGTPDAGVEVECFSGQFLGGDLALVGRGAAVDEVDGAGLLPGLEGLDLVNIAGILDPLDDLSHCDEVNVVVGLEDLIDPVEEGVQELGVVLQPGGVEVETKRSSVLVVVAVEVVGQEVIELITSENVRARVNHGATGQVLIDGGVLPPVQLVHDHLPDSVGAGGATLEITVAPVGHAEVHGVGPEWGVLERSGDGRVIEESLFFHHGELIVASDPEVWSTKTDDRVVSDVGELVDDQPAAGHLFGPLVNAGIGPEELVGVVSDGVSGNLVTKVVHVLDGGVVAVLVRDKEGGLDVAAVGVLALLVEDFLVQVNVVVVDGVVEGDCDHLGNVLAVGSGGSDSAETAGNLCSVLRAEAVGKFADVCVASRSSVGIGVNLYRM